MKDRTLINSSGEPPIEVLVVDDHPVVRRSIALGLARHGHIKVVGEIGDEREVLAQARALRPDVILMDISMPRLNGLALTRLLQQTLPASKVLILSVYDDTEYVRQAIQAGARGYLPKAAVTTDLVNAVETVQRGEFFFSANMVWVTLEHSGGAAPNGSRPRLTQREREVLVEIAEGRRNKEIAGRLGVSVRTVEYHRNQLQRKLNLHSAAGLTRFAIARGWVPAGPGTARPGRFDHSSAALGAPEPAATVLKPLAGARMRDALATAAAPAARPCGWRPGV